MSSNENKIDRFEQLLPETMPFGSKRFTESHTYVVYESTGSEQTLYVLDKAPVQRVESIQATVDGTRTELTKNVDYMTIDTSQNGRPDSVQFETGTGVRPDAGTSFTVEYVAQTVIERYASAYQDESEVVEGRVDSAIESHQIDGANGDDLDQIGALFGVIGERRGRTDQEYRQFLKSVVQSFRGRGTKPGMKFAISSGLGIEESQVTINERFSDNSYTLEIGPYLGDTRIIRQLAELSDPSGVKYRGLVAYTLSGGTLELSGEPLSATRIVSETLGSADLGDTELGASTSQTIY